LEPSPLTYDDRRIARIKPGETTEDQLLEWFGEPESRDAAADGQLHLAWSFPKATEGPFICSGVLKVSLASNGKVEAYSANQRDAPAEEGPYDDRAIARISRGKTSEDQLLQWFGRPGSRAVKADRQTSLSWAFWGKGTNSHSGALSVSLDSEGKVNAYSARMLRTTTLPRAKELESKAKLGYKPNRPGLSTEGTGG
jgi:hypothetical protein